LRGDDVIAECALVSAMSGGPTIELAAKAGAALLALLVATILSVYEPRGMTGYGWCKEQEQRMAS